MYNVHIVLSPITAQVKEEERGEGVFPYSCFYSITVFQQIIFETIVLTITNRQQINVLN